MSEISIRKATLDDLKAIQDLNHELFISDNEHNHDLNLDWPYQPEGEKYFRDCITQPERLASFVAEEDGKVIGYLNACIQHPHSAYLGKRAEIENMSVAEAYRSRGVGSLLIDEFKKWADEKGADRLIVTAFSRNDGAIRFYEKNGFTSYALTLSQVENKKGNG